jgi:hypothetical protein
LEARLGLRRDADGNRERFRSSTLMPNYGQGLAVTDRELFIRDNCVCVYCGFDGKISPTAWHQIIIEHVIPLRCKGSERKKHALDVDANKRVACCTCNNFKRVWDKKYDEATLPGTLPEQVSRAIADATKFLREQRYAEIDSDYEPMMEEIRMRGAKSVA